MTFDEVLPLLREGKRARRQLWIERFNGGYIELVTPGAVSGGRSFEAAMFYWSPQDEVFRPWVPAWDLLADDWEIL